MHVRSFLDKHGVKFREMTTWAIIYATVFSLKIAISPEMALIKSGNCYGHFNPKPTKKGREGIVIVQMCAKRSPQQISLWLDSQKSGNWKKKSWFTLKISQLRLTPRISQLNQKPERRLLRALPNRLSSTKTTREPAEKSGSLIFDKTKKKPSFDH